MPLLVMCGLPCAGKSARVAELVQCVAAEYPDVAVNVVSLEALKIDRADGYKGESGRDPSFLLSSPSDLRGSNLLLRVAFPPAAADTRSEKLVNGELRSAVERSLNVRRLVIIDGA